MSSSIRRALVIAPCAVLIASGAGALASAKAGGSYPPSQQQIERALKRKSFVGRVHGTRFEIGIAVAPGAKPIAYVCDTRGKGHWLTARALHLKRHGHVYTGRVRLNGALHRFRAVRAIFPGGLYEGTNAKKHGLRGTWIILNDGTVAGSATKAGKAVDGTVSPDTGEAEVGGTTIVTGSGGGTNLQPLRKGKLTKTDKCKALQSEYDMYTAFENDPAQAQNKQFWHDMANATVQAAVNMGCFAF